MRTKSALNDPPVGASFEGPFPPGNGPSTAASMAVQQLLWRLPRTPTGGLRQVPGTVLRMRCWPGAPPVAKPPAMSKRPRVDHGVLQRQAQATVLAGLLCGDDVDALVASVAPSHVPGCFTPDVAMLELAVTALDLASVPGSAPLESRACASATYPRSSSAVASSTTAASTHCTPPPACAEASGQTCSTTQAAGKPACGSTRLRRGDLKPSRFADRRSTTLEQVARDLAARHGLDEDVKGRVRSHDTSTGSRH